MVNVIIGDSNQMGCQLMAIALRRSRYRVAIAGTSSDAEGILALFQDPSLSINVAVISAHLREGRLAGLKVLREIHAAYPKTGIVALLESSTRDVVVEAFRAGASGILSREEPFGIVCKCIQVVSQGKVWATSRELRFALDALAQTHVTENGLNNPVKPLGVLTKREEGVVHLVAEGLTNREISKHLKLSEHTVRNYIFRIFNKVGTSNRLELALYAIDRKKNHPPPPQD